MEKPSKKVLRQLYWGLAFAIPFTVWAIWDSYQPMKSIMANPIPPPPKVDYDIIWDYKTEQWIPLRRGKDKPLNEDAIEKAKNINFDNLRYDPEFDPLYEPEINH